MQMTDIILMIKPVAFNYNAETAVNNYYQKVSDNMTSEEIQIKALQEFNGFVEILQNVGVHVIVFEDTKVPHTPDSIFPNNWISFHSDGSICIFPMYAKNRRLERREDILDDLSNNYNLDVKQIKYFTDFERYNKYLEGTGSMVLDRENKICYAAISIRTDKLAVVQFCKEFNYTAVFFTANQTVNKERLPIYHTNVMMCVADKFVIICLDSIDNQQEREHVIKRITDSDKEIIEITEEQKNSFAGNMLQLRGDKVYLVMSKSAFISLTDQQKNTIEKYCHILYSSLDIIECFGGGSARCMMAEVFLPKKLK